MSEIPQFGEPVKEVNAKRTYRYQEYWEAVLQHAKFNHGQWIPLLNAPFTLQRLQEIAWGTRNGSTANMVRHVPKAIRVPGFQARVAQGVLHFRYDKPED